MAVITCTVCILGAQDGSYQHWTYVPFPPLVHPVTWMDHVPSIYTNDSQWIPKNWHNQRPGHLSEKGMTMNLTVGFKTPPICFGQV